MRALEGRRIPSWIVLALAVAGASLPACGGSDASEKGRAATEPAQSKPKPARTVGRLVRTSNPGVTFAPRVHLHAREEHFPIGVKELVASSTLYWASGGTCGAETLATGPVSRPLTPVEVPTLEPRRLGPLHPFEHATVPSDCGAAPRKARLFHTGSTARPYGYRFPDGPPDDQGFNLNILTARLPGHRPDRAGRQAVMRDVPMYYQEIVDALPGLRISYWMAYGATEPPGTGPANLALQHEGGWERVSVLLRRGIDRYRPLSLRFHTYGGGYRDVPWTELRRVADGPGGQRTHPVIFAARGTHTPYPSPGRRERTVRIDGRRYALEEETAACPRCPVWKTWELARDARKQSWFGFGGAWGAMGSNDATTGPPGPGPQTPPD